MKKRIVHVISKDKFTSGYVNFFKTEMREWAHYFIIRRGGFNLCLVDNKNVIYMDTRASIMSKKIRLYLNNSDKIIISGVWNPQMLYLWLRSNCQKTYLHFWGGDFYEFRCNNKFSLEHVKTSVIRSFFQHARGLVFLIEGEYERFVDITGVRNNNYVAPMPMDSDPNRALSEIVCSVAHETSDIKHDKIRFLVGNSATPSNQHQIVFDYLSRFRDEDIEVHVPLSYGDEKYKNKVLSSGVEMFGKSFFPMTKFMGLKDYVRYLKRVDVAIFNNDRQQAMGNILALIGLGKKVYLREDTPMWKEFQSRGYHLFSISSLVKDDISKIRVMDSVYACENMKLFNSRDFMEEAKRMWGIVLDA